MKSMLMIVQARSGIGRDCKSPGEAELSVLQRWQTTHSHTHRLTSLKKPSNRATQRSYAK